MQEQNGLGLGTAQRGGSGRSLLVKNTTAADMATIRDTFNYKVDPIDGSTLIFPDIDSAINAIAVTSRANLGDKIFVSEGYTETLSTAGDIASDVAGVSIIGLGEGSARPTFTFSAVGATWAMSGAGSVLKNVIFKPSVDSVVSPLVVSGADCTVDIEIQDASSAIEFVRGVLTTSAANRLKLKLKYEGFSGGDACVNAVRLVGGIGADIEIDFFGKASTAVVQFSTTAVVDAKINGYMYNSGTTDYSKDVVDTVTGSTWYAEIEDGAAGASVSGGSGNPLAAGDLSAIATAVSTTIPNSILGLPRSIEKSDGAVLSGDDPLFTVTGGPIDVLSITGIVTTQIGAGTTNVKLTLTTVTPAATVDMSAGAVDIDADAAGTSYRHINTTAILTPVTAGFVMKGNAFATNDTQFLVPIGTINLNSSAARAGVIKWYLRYVPLSENSRVAAAA
jgi:hypothetical protein